MVNTKEKILNVRAEWICNEVNKQACIDFWNSFAAAQKDIDIPTFENDSFLMLLKKENMLKSGGSSLDIGCGTGKYSFALSDSFKDLVGFDISPEMLKVAKEKATELNKNNIDFICSQWQSIDIEEAGYKNKFDLVFAHMTPAISNASTFEKMTEASKGFCAMSKPTRRIDPILDRIMDALEVKAFKGGADEEIIYAFELLWAKGYCPKFDYENQIWRTQKSISQATDMYIKRIKQYKNISEDEEKQIFDIVKSFEANGQINEEINTLITTMYWKV